MMKEPSTIDHDPNEPKRGYKPVSWRLLWAIVVIGWIGYLTSRPFDWYGIAIGGLTGLMLASWAIEITGNKVPDSWKTKSRGDRR